jgi:ABC-type proline/glycine betaine transport system permease subunit
MTSLLKALLLQALLLGALSFRSLPSLPTRVPTSAVGVGRSFSERVSRIPCPLAKAVLRRGQKLASRLRNSRRGTCARTRNGSITGADSR